MNALRPPRTSSPQSARQTAASLARGGFARRPARAPVKPHFVLALCAMALCLLSGCKVPAQIVWSPDGKQAVWRSGSRAVLLAESGEKGEDLGETAGGFAWSADSQSLYFVAAAADGVAPSPAVDLTGRTPSTAPTAMTAPTASAAATNPAGVPASQASDDGGGVQSLGLMVGGKVTILTSFAAKGVWHMQLSPDGNWLAMVAYLGSNGEDRVLLVYSIVSNKLILLEREPGMGVCFVGPNELAFAAAWGDGPEEKLFGHLVQVRLDDAALADGAAEIKRKVILDVMPMLTPWMWPDREKGELLFTARPLAFPSKPQKLEDGLHKLYHVSIADGGVSAIIDDVGPMFLPSPDGKRVLVEKVTPANESRPARRELAVINVNGSSLQPLRDVSMFDGILPMWPSWRGNNQIAYIGEESRAVTVGEETRDVYDVVLYQLPDGGTLSPVRTLSESWPDDLRPTRKDDRAAKTAPMAAPATVPASR